MVFATYAYTDPLMGICVRWMDEQGYPMRSQSISQNNVFPKTTGGLNLAFETSAALRLKEAMENNELTLLPTEVAYIAQIAA